jgi:hypothetical protein
MSDDYKRGHKDKLSKREAVHLFLKVEHDKHSVVEVLLMHDKSVANKQSNINLQHGININQALNRLQNLNRKDVYFKVCTINSFS